MNWHFNSDMPIYTQLISQIKFAIVSGELPPGERMSTVRDLAAEDMTMMVVTHEMAFAREVADRVVFMEGGAIVEEGPPEQLFNSENPRTRQFLGGRQG